MRGIGFWMLILGIGSFLLNMAGREFVLLMWVDQWGPTMGTVIRLGVAGLGVVLMVAGGSEEGES